MKLFFVFLSNLIGLYLIGQALPTVIAIQALNPSQQFANLLLASLILTFFQEFIGPLLRFLGFPFILLTLGIGLFFIHVLFLWLTDLLLPALHITGFINYLFVTAILLLIRLLVKKAEKPHPIKLS